MMNEIAEKIRSLRKEKSLTLKDLSQKTGLSISFLSQVENGTSSLAITSLKKIADALNVPINLFFKSYQNHNFLVKSEEQHKFRIEGSNSQFVNLSGDFPQRSLESMIVIISANETHGHKFNHPGEEFVYVLEGALTVYLEDNSYIVESGDSIHYPSTLAHEWVNHLDYEIKLLVVLTPVIF